MAQYLNRSEIIEHAHGFKTDVVDVPEWGGRVLVREMSVPEVTEVGMNVLATSGKVTKEEIDELGAVDNLASFKLDIKALGSLFPIIVAWCVVDENMNSLFTLGDVQQMTSASSEPVQRIAQKALILSGLFVPGDESDDAEEEEEIAASEDAADTDPT